MTRKRDKISLWRDNSLPDGLELLRASCFDYRYPAHFHEEFVIAAFARGAQRHRIGRHDGVAGAGSVMIIPPGEVQTAEAAERDRGWEYCAFYPSARFLDPLPTTFWADVANLISALISYGTIPQPHGTFCAPTPSSPAPLIAWRRNARPMKVSAR
ncbi:AraC family ligand binding domain-containing protein [Paracoccus kondratievae]